MSDKFYKFKVSYKDTRNNTMSSTTIEARTVREAKEIFKSRPYQFRQLVSCVRADAFPDPGARARPETTGAKLGGLLGGALLAAGAAVVAGVMNKKSK